MKKWQVAILLSLVGIIAVLATVIVIRTQQNEGDNSINRLSSAMDDLAMKSNAKEGNSATDLKEYYKVYYDEAWVDDMDDVSEPMYTEDGDFDSFKIENLNVKEIAQKLSTNQDLLNAPMLLEMMNYPDMDSLARRNVVEMSLPDDTSESRILMSMENIASWASASSSVQDSREARDYFDGIANANYEALDAFSAYLLEFIEQK